MTKQTDVKEVPCALAANHSKDGSNFNGSAVPLNETFADPQGMLDAQYKTLDDIKDDCLVALDANVLLLPYGLDSVTLGKLIAVYRQLAKQGQLIIPAQAAREFGKHRSKKIAEIVQYLRNQADQIALPFNKPVGLLADDPEFLKVKDLASEIGDIGKQIREKIEAIIEKISSHVGRDPVSDSYREVFAGRVIGTGEPANQAEFALEMKRRYSNQIPPGYKDSGKLDGGGGDLLIWQSILRAATKGSRDSIFVTTDSKSDWYTQSNGAFQPRLELLEEYRVTTGGGTIHIIPPSRLLQLYHVDDLAVANTRIAETTVTIRKEVDEALMDEEQEWIKLLDELDIVSRKIEHNRDMLGDTVDDFNTSLSLPWNRAAHSLRWHLVDLVRRKQEIEERLSAIKLNQAHNLAGFKYDISE